MLFENKYLKYFNSLLVIVTKKCNIAFNFRIM